MEIECLIEPDCRQVLFVDMKPQDFVRSEKCAADQIRHYLMRIALFSRAIFGTALEIAGDCELRNVAKVFAVAAGRHVWPFAFAK